MSIIKPFEWMKTEDIENKANEILLAMQSRSKTFPRRSIDPNRIADFLDLRITYEKIPSDNNGKIAARIIPSQQLIEINEDIPSLKQETGFAAFTIAHEIGHWVLHINQDEVNGLTKQQELALDVFKESAPFLCRSSSGETSDKREWQADYFAGSLLMPHTLLKEIVNGKNLQDLTHLRKIAEGLGVSLPALRVRLQKIGWTHTSNNSQRSYLDKTFFNSQGNLF